MKDKIFNALKQEFTHLGLGDEILMARAEALASTGLVTDENLKSVVDSQKASLEGLQKDNDKRVAAALAKVKKEYEEAKAKSENDHAAALKAESDKLAKALKDLEETKAKLQASGGGKGDDDKFTALEAAFNKKLEDVQATIKTLNEANAGQAATIKKLEDEKTAADKAAAAKARKESIAAKAKEKGIPDWLVARGFAEITEETTDEQIDTILSGFAQDVKTNFLPSKDSAAKFSGEKATKADTDAMVAKLKL